MKRMITQELIDKIIAFFGNIIASADQITIMSKLHLLDVTDIEVSDLGSLFPTPSDDKLLAWDGGVLKNVDFPVSFTHSFAELDETLQGIVDDAFTDAGENGVACTEAQWNVIKALLNKSLVIHYGEYNMFASFNDGINIYVFGGATANASLGESIYMSYDDINSLLFAKFIEL